MNSILKSKKGFTVVEILIAVIIIGLMAAMAVPAFSAVRESAQTKTCINNLRQISAAKDQYFLEHGRSEPLSLAMLVGGERYIKNAPKCPIGGDSYKDTLDADAEPECTSGQADHIFPSNR